MVSTQSRRRVAIDIETVPDGPDGDALDPGRGRIVAFGLWAEDSRGNPVRVAEHADGGDHAEGRLLRHLVRLVENLGAVEIIGWNSGAFDMPWLAYRYRYHGMHDDGPQLARTGKVGKYGDPVYDVSWKQTGHRDISFEWEAIAAQAGLRWGLKAVATACGLETVEVDQTRIAELSEGEVLAYQLSDVRVTYQLDCIPLNKRLETATAAPTVGSTTDTGADR